MSRGYKVLVADKFFGDIENIDWDQVKLIDKINLEAKIGNLVDVPFNDEERALLLKTMTTEEFSEVLDVVRDILAYTKENQEELLNPPTMPEPDFDDTDNDEENEDPTSNMGHDDMEGNDENETEQNAKPGDSESDTENESEKDVSESEINPNPEYSDEDFSITDSIFRRMEKTLIPESSEFEFGNEVKREQWEKHVINFDELMQKREARFNNNFKYYDDNSYILEMYKDQMPLTHRQEDDFIEYIKKAKKSIQPAVKEFEQKKAAHRWMHASTAKTGRLDVNKLHNYKLSEDIFLKTTRLADEKSHGMFMLIDYSGSMSNQLSNVLDQVIHSVLFCKAVNIPFNVYSFSTECQADVNYHSTQDGDVWMDNLSLCQLIHSKLNKNKLETALKWLYARTNAARGVSSDWVKAREEDWGSTPLNQALIISHKLIKEFKLKNNIEKVTLLSITDGDTNRLRIIDDKNIEKIEPKGSYYWDRKVKMTIDGKQLTMDTGRKGTVALYKNIKKRYNANIMGFFVAESNHELKNKIYDVWYEQNDDNEGWYGNEFAEFRKSKVKENTKNKCIEFNNALGYDSFFVVKGSNFKIDDDDLDTFITEDDATDSQIKNAFKKMARNKKTNKNLMTKFGKAVAV